MYFNNKLANSTNKPKTTWNIIKTITNNKKNPNDILKIEINGKIATHHQTIAEEFNNYYVSAVDSIINNNNLVKNITGDLNKNDPLNYLHSAFPQSFINIKLKNTTTGEIEKIIKELKNKNSCGYDEITAKILKQSSPFIVSPLTHICNSMLSTGIFPGRLKYSIIKPIYKKGDKTLITNYRPISLLPVFSKILEKIVYKRLYYHLTLNSILVKEQFGFRYNSTTETAIFTLINNILLSLNNRILVGGLFCDLQKAFDCVNHNILLAKMEFYGITGVANRLMESYLRNRYQRVTINGGNNSNDIYSKWKVVQHGVPQGSVLGPLLFLMYINDLPKSVSDMTSPILFADDTSFIIADHDETEFKLKTIKITNAINKWFCSNLLMLNCDKTYFLPFSTKTDTEINIQVSFGNKKITTVQSLKFLGLNIDTTLTWKYHIGELSSRLNKACYAIRSIKPYMSLTVLRSTYFAYVHSIISYGIIFWGNSSCSDVIFKIQKRIIRVIMNSKRNTSCRQLFKELNILPIQSQYIYSILLFVIKNKDQFLSNMQVHKINTRQTFNLYVPTANLTMYQRGVYYSGVRIYNHLPTAIKDLSNDTKKFKLALKKYLSHNSFYSLEEYFNT